jgi:hypothetical protein
MYVIEGFQIDTETLRTRLSAAQSLDQDFDFDIWIRDNAIMETGDVGIVNCQDTILIGRAIAVRPVSIVRCIRDTEPLEEKIKELIGFIEPFGIYVTP